MAKKEEPSLADLGMPPIDPVENQAPPASEQGETSAPRKRGRPRGSTNKPAGEGPKKSASRKMEDEEAFAKQLQGIHTLVAMATGFPEMAIGETESRMLAKGISAVTEEYGLSLDGKTGAAFQLIGAAAIVYVPRAMMVRARLDEAKKQRQAEEDKTLDGSSLVTPTYASSAAH